jgi:sorting nexin-8
MSDSLVRCPILPLGTPTAGAELTLIDSTDLPVPTLSGLSGSTAASSRPNELAAKPPQRPTTPPHSLTTEPAVPNSARTVRKASIEFPDTDPWATPDVHKTHGHAVLTGTNGNHIHSPTANGAPAAYGAPESALPGRTTSNFTTAGGDPGSRTGGAPPASGGTGWGYFDGNPSSTSSGYDEPSSNPGSNPFGGAGAGSGARNGGEGEGGDHTGGQAPIPTPSRTIGSGRTGSSIEENITISLLPEKEGMFMFQHHNYEVSSSRRASKVIRRYSDFVWLLDCLHKRYPFRVLPLLPPKRVAVNGNHLSNDGAFIEKRRRGLARFLNALVRHPVLGQEQLVVMFLTVPTELSVWRKQATYSVQDEFTDRPLPPGLEDSLSPQLNDLFDRTRNGVRRSADLYINICSVMDRLVKRDEGVAADHARIAMSLASLTETSADTYATDTNDVPLLNDGLIAMSQHLRTAQTLMEDEARAWDEGVLEDLKRQRDALVAVRDLFDRRERLDRDTIPFLERRIQGNETKLAGLRAKPEGLVKPGEIEKVVEAIIKVRLPPSRALFISNASLTWLFAGQGINCTAAQPLRLRQGVHSQRACNLPAHAVPRLALEPGLGSRAGQVCRDAGR